MPNGDSALRGPREAEHARDIVRCRRKVEFGATDKIVVELPGKRAEWRTDDVVPSNTFPTAYYELQCAESWECISADFPDGDDILYRTRTAIEMCATNFCSLSL